MIQFSIIKDNEPIQNNETNMTQYTPRDLCENPSFPSSGREFDSHRSLSPFQTKVM